MVRTGTSAWAAPSSLIFHVLPRDATVYALGFD